MPWDGSLSSSSNSLGPRVEFNAGHNSYERIVNESTSTETAAGGMFNAKVVAEFLEEERNACAYAIGLAIPLVNMIVGLVALGRLLKTPISVCDIKLKGVARNILVALVLGLVLFASSYWVAGEVLDRDFRTFFGVLWSILIFVVAFRIYGKSSGANHRQAKDLVQERSGQLDEETRRFRATYGT